MTRRHRNTSFRNKNQTNVYHKKKKVWMSQELSLFLSRAWQSTSRDRLSRESGRPIAARFELFERWAFRKAFGRRDVTGGRATIWRERRSLINPQTMASLWRLRDQRRPIETAHEPSFSEVIRVQANLNHFYSIKKNFSQWLKKLSHHQKTIIKTRNKDYELGNKLYLH